MQPYQLRDSQEPESEGGGIVTVESYVMHEKDGGVDRMMFGEIGKLERGRSRSGSQEPPSPSPPLTVHRSIPMEKDTQAKWL